MRTQAGLLLLLVFGVSALSASGQTFDARAALGLSGPAPTVMVLGTHHMGNPNRDAVKTSYDDPRSPQRQAELRQLVDKLRAYKPTKIAIEAPYGSTAAVEKYQQYLRWQYELTADEVDQIAFRLGKELGHSTVYPIDWRNDMDISGVMEFAAKNDQPQIAKGFETAMGAIGAWQKQLQGKSILDMYRIENDPELQGKMQAMYVRMVEVGKDSVYKGADVVTSWYERNLKIAANILRTARDPNDRVLVLIGNGHAYYLNEILGHSPSVRLEMASTYLR